MGIEAGRRKLCTWLSFAEPSPMMSHAGSDRDLSSSAATSDRWRKGLVEGVRVDGNEGASAAGSNDDFEVGGCRGARCRMWSVGQMKSGTLQDGSAWISMGWIWITRACGTGICGG